MSSNSHNAALIEYYSQFCRTTCQNSVRSTEEALWKAKYLSESETTAEIWKEPYFKQISNQSIFLITLMESLTRECELLLLDAKETAESLRKRYPIEVFEVAQVRVLFRSPPSSDGTLAPIHTYKSPTSPINSHPVQAKPIALPVNQATNIASHYAPQVIPVTSASNISPYLSKSSAFPSHAVPSPSNETSKNSPYIPRATGAPSPIASPIIPQTTLKPAAASPYFSAAPAQGIPKQVSTLHPYYTSSPLQPYASGSPHVTGRSSANSGPPR